VPSDYYEILQISPNADQETVRRIYKIQAQRFHPDNLESGDAEMFKRIAEAYEILSDPDRRAEYDTSHRIRRPAPEPAEPPAADPDEEADRRDKIVLLLYRQRLSNPDQPSLGLRDLENHLKVSKDRLEFSLWYLKQCGYITRTDSARHTITIQGVQLAETIARRPAGAQRIDR